jgi:hypothetical protein
MFWTGYTFLYDLISLFINGVILYFIGLRSYVEVQEGKHYLYLGSAIIGLIATGLTENFLKGWLIWRFTTWIIISFVIAQAVIIFNYYYKKKKK